MADSPDSRPRAPDAPPATAAEAHPGGSRGEPPESPLSVLPWALASFHAATLVVVPLGLGYAVDPRAVGGLLDGLDTRLGLGLYLLLWGSTWVTNRRWLASASLSTLGALGGGARWGAVTGLPLLVGVVALVAVAVNPVFAALVAVVGSLVAPLVGAVVGAAFALVDVGCYRLAGRFV